MVVQAAPSFDELQPMLLGETKSPFTDAAWCFEVKYDGYRALAEWGGAGAPRIKSRQGTDMTRWFAEIGATLATAGGGRCVVDGEVCVLNEHGIAGDAEFRRLFRRQAGRGRRAAADPVVYCVFDLLIARGRSVMRKPLAERKDLLAKLLGGLPGILVVGHVEREGTALYKQALKLELEGLVAKRLDSPYLPGVRSPAWLKIKRPGAVPAERFKSREA